MSKKKIRLRWMANRRAKREAALRQGGDSVQKADSIKKADSMKKKEEPLGKTAEKREAGAAGKTVLGLAGAVAIALLGFYLPGVLLQRHVQNALSQRHTAAANTEQDVQLELPREEYGDVLELWYAQSDGSLAIGQTREYHEPVSGQIAMDEAIEAARKAAQVFQSNGVFPGRCDVDELQSGGAVLYNSTRAGSTRDYRASFWEVTLSSDDCFIVMQINAVTAQAWDVKAMFRPSKADNWVYFEDQILRMYAYAEYLGCQTGMVDENYDCLYDEQTMRFFLYQETFNLLCECSRGYSYDDDPSGSVLRIRMIPKGYTYDDLMQEYDNMGMEYFDRKDITYFDDEQAARWAEE